MKKIISLALVLMLVLAFASCGSQDTSSADVSSTVPVEKVEVNFAALKGPTGIGAVKIVNSSCNTEAVEYKSTLYGDPTDVVAEAIKGAVDIAAVPSNSAAVIFNKTEGKYKVLCLNTLGTLYILENGETVKSIADLNGKTVYATGEGATPQYVLEYLLKENNVDCKVEYLSEHSELAAKMISGEVKLAMLPQPFVTQTTLKNQNVKIALDLTKEWDAVAEKKGDNSVLTMGCFIVKAEFAEAHPDTVAQFVKDFNDSVEYVNGDPAAAAKAVVEAKIMDSEPAVTKAIPNCNIVCVSGKKMKSSIMGFLNVLASQNPKAVGGKVPDESFCYIAK